MRDPRPPLEVLPLLGREPPSAALLQRFGGKAGEIGRAHV